MLALKLICQNTGRPIGAANIANGKLGGARQWPTTELAKEGEHWPKIPSVPCRLICLTRDCLPKKVSLLLAPGPSESKEAVCFTQNRCLAREFLRQASWQRRLNFLPVSLSGPGLWLEFQKQQAPQESESAY